MNYSLTYTDDALEDIRLLKRNEPLAYKKLKKLLIANGTSGNRYRQAGSIEG